MRPKRFGVKCLIYDGDKILLIKNNYGSKLWNLPGGGIKKNEKPESAAKREVKEELGIELKILDFSGQYSSNIEGKRDEIYCYSSKIPKVTKLRLSREIKEAKWFDRKELPEKRASAVSVALGLSDRL